ncbi:RING finger protein 37 [Halotydeus destructor]|nr:RING finger protein 37 [Halotydeus destructor]
MALNLCTENANTRISCSSSCADGFEVTNLISRSLSSRSKGFRVDYYVRPPIDVKVRFSLPVELSYISFGPRNGENEVAWLEILVRKKKEELVSLMKINCNKAKMVLKNSSYTPHYLSKKSCVDALDVSQDAQILYVPSYKKSDCYGVEEVVLRLNGMKGTSIPALGHLEIWGQPHLTEANWIQVEQFIKNYKSSDRVIKETGKVSFYGSSADDYPQPKRLRVEAELIESPKVQVPEEFRDILTNDIMSIPMTVPSGNTIDKSTLDKYIENESIWGRPPNDPFTGRFFSHGCEPVPNMGLKVRIDQFLIHNESLLTETLPNGRTVGRSVEPSSCQLLPRADGSHGNGDKSKNSECIACGLTHKTEEQMYRLPCSHVICRSKWVSLSKLTENTSCMKCKFPARGSQVVRVHL